MCLVVFTTNKPGLQYKYWKAPCFSPAEVSVQCYYLSFVGGGEISFCYIVICVSLPQVSEEEEEEVFLFPPCSLWAIICGLCFLLRPCSIAASLVRTVMMNVAVIYKAGDMDLTGYHYLKQIICSICRCMCSCAVFISFFSILYWSFHKSPPSRTEGKKQRRGGGRLLITAFLHSRGRLQMVAWWPLFPWQHC